MNRRLQDHAASLARPGCIAKLTCSLFLLACFEPVALAATKTWTGGDGNDSNWTSNGNWSGVLAPHADDDLVFSDALLRRTNVNNFTINTNFSSLSFSGSNWSISGNAVFLGANGTTGGITASVPSNNPTIFSPNILLGKNQAFNATSGTQFPYTLNGVINLQTHTLTLGGIGAHVLNGAIIGTGALVKSGTGTVFLNAASNLFGPSTINAGTFNIGSAASLGAVTLAGGTLRVDGSAGAIALQGGTLTGNGPVGNLTSSGAVAKTIAPAGAVGTPTAVMIAGTTILSPSTTLAIELNGTTAGTQHDRLDTTSINLNGATLSLSLGFLPSNGSAFTIVTGGGAGSVSGQFAQGTSITTAGGTVFSITYNSASVVVTRQPSTGTWSGAGSDNNWTTGANWVGGVAPVAGDNLVFPAGAARGTNNNNYTAGTNFKSIALNGAGYVIGGNSILLSNGISESVVTYPVGPDVRPQFNLGITLTAPQSFIANNNGFVLGGTVNLNGNLLTLNGPVIENLVRPSPALTGTIIGAGGITKAGVGEFSLTGANSYTGITNINAGVLAIGNNTALGATTAGNNTVVATGATLRITGEGIETAEPITLNGTGTASPDYAALHVSGCHTTPCAISGPVTLASNSDIAIVPPISNGTVTISGVIGESGGARTLTKANSSGTVILSAANTYTGGTTNAFGTLLVNGSIGTVALASGSVLGGTGTVGAISGIGTVAPGASAGILNTGNVTFAASDTLAMEIGGLTPGTQHDKLNVAGTVNLGGANLQGALINGFIPAAGNTFTIIQSSGAITGQFAQGSTITFNGVQFNITYNTNSVVLSIAAALLPDLTVAKTHTGNFVQGQVGAQYTATVTNSGAGDMAASSVSLVDTPPAGLSVTAMSGSGWTCAVLPTCTRADALSAFQSYPPVTITVNVAANATSPQINHVAVTTSASESSAANNSSDDSTSIDLPDMYSTMAHAGNFSQGLTGAQYVVTVKNGGAGIKPAATLVSLVDNVPAGLTLTGMSGTGWNCSVLPTCTRTDALGAFQTYPTITVTVSVAGNATSPQVNSVTVSTAATESNTGNNTTNDSTVIDPAADFVVTSTLDTDGATCSGTCTLRQAINAANLRLGADQIKFAIASGTPPFTISPALPLPTITDAVTINGYTQQGASANTLADGEDAAILIQVDGSNAGVAITGIGICAGGTVIRGLSITGFDARGIDIGSTTTLSSCPFSFTDVTVAGNFIGLLPDGSAGGNAQGGIGEFGYDNSIIGGGAAADRNVISANGKAGVFFSNGATGRRVDNNYIGTDPGGTLDFGNAERGLNLDIGTNNVAVGMIAPNRIAFNATGIAVSSTASTGNTLFANDFISNTNLGIDLGAAGSTANDADDADGGGNGGQNFPDLTGFTLGAGTITLNGTLDVPDNSSNAQYVIALYQSAACDQPSAFGEGEVFLGSKTVAFTGNGSAAPEPFSAQFNATPVVGGVFTATATDPNGSTSEFSACLPNGGPTNIIFQNSYE